MRKKIWDWSVVLGTFSAVVTGILATGLCAVACFVGRETVWDIIGGVSWSVCFIGQICFLVELFRRPATISE